MRMEKGKIAILLLFLIPMCLDLYSTLQAGEFVEHLEVNVIYKYVGIFGIVVFNFLILGGIYWAYGHNKPVGRFSLISIVVWLGAIRGYVIYSNLKVSEAISTGAVTLEQAAAIPEEAKTAWFMILSLSILLPWLITNICFWLFKLDHTIERK